MSSGVRTLRRRVGLDRNPLRRTSDRMETALVVALAIVFVVAAAGAFCLGMGVYRAGVAAERAQAATYHRVEATLVEDMPTVPMDTEASTTPKALVRVTWPAPDGTARSGVVWTDVPAKAGATVAVWVDEGGRLVSAPQSRGQTVGTAMLATAGTAMGAGLLLRLTFVAARRVLDRRRLAAWDVEWAQVASSWTGRS